MPMLTTAIEDVLPSAVVHHSSVSGGEGGDFGESEEEHLLLVEKEVHPRAPQSNDPMSALEKHMSSLSVSNNSIPSANDIILSEVIAQWDALSHREKDAGYQISASGGGGWDFVEYHRGRISSYYYTIIDGKNLDRRIVSIALSFLKMFLTRRPTAESKRFNKLAMLTALYMAIKIHSSNIYENGRPVVFITEVVNWSGHVFTTRDISRMESCMLNTLDYYMNPPVGQQFLDIITPLIDERLINPLDKQHIITISTWLCEISVTESSFTSIHPSTVVYAALLVAIDTSSAAASMKCWLEETLCLKNKNDELITSQCYDRMMELYYELEESPYVNDNRRCHSPTEVGVSLGI